MAASKKRKAKEEFDVNAIDTELLYRMLECACNCGNELIALWLCDKNRVLDVMTVPSIQEYLDSALALVAQIISRDEGIAKSLLRATGAICKGDKAKLDRCMASPELDRITNTCRDFLRACQAIGIKGENDDMFLNSSVGKKLSSMYDGDGNETAS